MIYTMDISIDGHRRNRSDTENRLIEVETLSTVPTNAWGEEIQNRYQIPVGSIFTGRGEQNSMRHPAFTFAFAFRPWAALCCMSALMLCGCAIFFGDKRSLVATVPAQSSSPANFKAVLTMSTHSVEFDGFQGHEGNQSLRISVINRGRHGFEVRKADGKFVPVTPGTRVEFYSGKITHSTNSISLPVSGVQSRTPCEFQVEVSSPSQFRNAIKIYVLSSSAPM